MDRKFLVIFIIAALLLIISLAVMAVFIGRDSDVFLTSFVEEDRCSPENQRAAADEVGQLVHHFEDVKFVAILTNREQLVGPILKLQDLRYETEALDLPVCLNPLEKSAIDYMNSVIVYLSHHMAGLDPDEVRREFLYSEELLQQYRDAFAEMTGETFEIPMPEVTPGG